MCCLYKLLYIVLMCKCTEYVNNVTVTSDLRTVDEWKHSRE